MHGYRIHLGTLGACRIGGRRPDIGHHDLAGPTRSDEGRAVRPQSQREDLYRDFIVAAHSVWQCRREQRAQIQEIVALYAMISRMRILSSPTIVVCADNHARNDRHLLRAEQDDPRAA
jgi:hypothetical protein